MLPRYSAPCHFNENHTVLFPLHPGAPAGPQVPMPIYSVQRRQTTSQILQGEVAVAYGRPATNPSIFRLCPY
jgi:hypothetical protein